MKTIKDDIQVEKTRRLCIRVDAVNFILSLAAITLSVIAMVLVDTPKSVYLVIFSMAALIAFLNVIRFYRINPKISSVCLIVSAALVTLCILI